MQIEIGGNDRLISLEDGQVLCEKGDLLGLVYQVRSGTLVAYDGEVELATLVAPALIGDISAVAGGVATASVRAVGNCSVAVIDRRDFAQWLQDHPDHAAAITAVARDRADRTRATGIVTELMGSESPQAVKGLVDHLTFTTLAPGDLLFAQGDPSDAAYIVITGRVRIRRVDDDGAVTLDTDLGRGALIGELGIIEDQPRSASVRATRSTTLARLTAVAFAEATASNPGVTLRVVRTILDRMQRSTRHLTRNRAVTVAATDPTVTEELLSVVVDEVRRFGPAELLTRESVDAALARPGISASPPGSIGAERLTDFILEAEASSDFVVLQADQQEPLWTERAVEHSDRLLIFVSARPDATERERIDALLERSVNGASRTTWIVKRYQSTTRPFGAGEWLRDARVDDVHHVRVDSPADLRRVARLATGNGVGVVLGGGGARGFAHLGACRALEELDVPIDVVGGASIGSVIGAVLAMQEPLENRDQLIADAFSNLFDYTVPVVALLRSQNITDNINKHLGSFSIENTWLPYSCVTTNLTTAGVTIHRSGNLGDAVRASVAIPGLLPPVTIDGELHVDGGVLDNLPVDLLANDDRVSTVIALDLTPPEPPVTRRDFSPSVSGFAALKSRLNPREDNYPFIASTITQSLLTASSRRRAEVIAEGNFDLCIVLDLPGVGLLDFDRVFEVSAIGYEVALPQIRSWLATQPPDLWADRSALPHE